MAPLIFSVDVNNTFKGVGNSLLRSNSRKEDNNVGMFSEVGSILLNYYSIVFLFSSYAKNVKDFMYSISQGQNISFQKDDYTIYELVSKLIYFNTIL